MKAFLDPIAWLWFTLLGTTLWLAWRRRNKAAYVLGAITVAWWLVEFLALPTRLLAGLEDRIPAAPGPWDAAVVLGGGWSPALRPPLAVEANDAFDRLLAGVEAVRTGQADELWLGGGFGRMGGSTDGECARDWMLRWRLLPPDKVVVLPPSKSTREEATHAAERAMGVEAMRIGVVTSAWHMPRAIKEFQRVGLTVGAVPCDYLAAGTRAYGKRGGRNWLPRQGSLEHLYLWLSEVVGRWR